MNQTLRKSNYARSYTQTGTPRLLYKMSAAMYLVQPGLTAGMQAHRQRQVNYRKIS